MIEKMKEVVRRGDLKVMGRLIEALEPGEKPPAGVLSAAIGASLSAGVQDRMVEMLLEAGADPCERGEGGVQPIHIAAVQGRWNIARLLLKHGAGINAQDDGGRTALHRAALGAMRTGRMENLNFFLKLPGADDRLKDAQGRTPLAFAEANPQLCLEAYAKQAESVLRAWDAGRAARERTAHERQQAALRKRAPQNLL